MTRRFAVGHNLGENGELSVARLWRGPRYRNPGGGLAAALTDQLSFARFHLGDGRAESGERVLPAGVLAQMREPTAELRGTNLGDGIGIGWFLRDVDGVRTVGHAGSANGQFAELLLVPDREFAVVSLSNEGPHGTAFNQAVVAWVLENYLGVTNRDPEPLPYDEERARQLVGRYENEAMTLEIATDGTAITLAADIKSEIRAAADEELPPGYPREEIGLLPRDEYIITDGGMKGVRGFFTRDDSSAVVGIDVGGRLHTRVATAARSSPERD